MQAIVWISGPSSGIGKALVETVPFDDARMIDISRGERPSRAEHLAADLADPPSWEMVGDLDEQSSKRKKFVDLHDEGKLSDPRDGARRLWNLLDAGLDNGTVSDPRKLVEADVV